MKRTAFTFIAALSAVCAQARYAAAADTATLAGDTLREVTVRRAGVIRKADRTIFVPTAQQKEKAVNGLELTRMLALPRVFVNTVDNSIGMAGGEALQLRINGVEATAQEVLALSPDDIRRVEYHDRPGLRYGDGVGAVADYITVRRTDGGNAGVSLMQETNTIGAHQAYGRLHSGRSLWGADCYTNYHSYGDVSTDGQEQFRLPDGSTISRRADGLPADNSEIIRTGRISYSYTDGDRLMMSARLSITKFDVTAFQNRSILYSLSSPDFRTVRETDAPRHLDSPTLNLYLYRKLKGNQSVAFDVVGTYNGTRRQTSFTERYGEETYTDLRTDVRSRRYSLIAEAAYEKQWGGDRLTAGLKHTQAKTDNTYSGDTRAETHAHDAETYGYAQFTGRAASLTYTVGLGATRTAIRQEGEEPADRWTLSPMLQMYYDFNDRLSANLSYRMHGNNPSLSNMSDVEQPIDSLQVLRGNPALRTYSTHTFSLDIDYGSPALRTGLAMAYSLADSPVMEQTTYDDARALFVRGYDNQRRFETLNADIYANIFLFSGHLNFYLNGGISHHISTGNAYRHRRNVLYYTSLIQATMGRFDLSGLFVCQQDEFYGETLKERNRYNMFTLSYKPSKDMRVGVGIQNPFGEWETATTRRLSALAASEQRAHFPALTRSVIFTFSWNVSFGRQYREMRKRIENSDKEDGILK